MIYAIADLHLSLGTDKPMDVFTGWNDYVSKLENNWKKIITDKDTVVIAGDISWAMKLEECYEDFSFINSLPGQKVFIKGNHDYWWGTKKKIDDYLELNKFNSIKIVFNNAYPTENIAICGTRGWIQEPNADKDVKVLAREVGRLETSIKAAVSTGLQPVVFLHYPPIYDTVVCKEILDILKKYEIKNCYYGHLHGSYTHRYAVTGDYEGINFHLISCDYTGFVPVPVA